MDRTGDDLFNKFSAKLKNAGSRLKLELSNPPNGLEYSRLEFFCTDDNNIFVKSTLKKVDETNEIRNVLPVLLIDGTLNILSGIENEQSVFDKYLIKKSLINDVALITIVDNVESQVGHYESTEKWY